MASLQIEGDMCGLRHLQIRFICDVLEKRGFKNNKVFVEPVGKTGDNYGANVLRITTIVDDGEDFKMIAKIAPEDETARKGINTPFLFKNEILMYQEVLPKLVSLQVAANVSEKDLFRYAECHGCLAEEPHEIILLEDLKESNFVMLDKYSSLDNDAVKLILKNFAVIHSLSYVLKIKEAETYDRFRRRLTNIWSLMSGVFKPVTAKLEVEAIAVVDEKYKDSLRDVVSQMTVFGKHLFETQKGLKHLVIQHGDSWTNNLMFKLEGGVPSECIMIDYQVSKEANPMCDFLQMVFNCTDHITRSKYYFEWIDYYHDQLVKLLAVYGIDANSVYPRQQLDADLKSYSKMYLGISVMVSSVLCKSPEEAAMKQEEVSIAEDIMIGIERLSDDSIKLFKSKVEGLIESYRLFGYL